jgi:hypothetical protein
VKISRASREQQEKVACCCTPRNRDTKIRLQKEMVREEKCSTVRTAKESCMLLDSAMFSDKKYNYQYGWFAKMLVQVS